MPEGLNGLTPIVETRRTAEQEVLSKFPWMKGDEKELQVQIYTFEAVDKSQITRELATELLEVRERFFRELANQELADGKDGPGAEIYFNVWSEIDDALKGAKGKAPVSSTIDYFRQSASRERKTAESIMRELNGDEPTRLSDSSQLFERISLISKNLPKREKAAENYDTAARLFETSKKINWVIRE